MIIVSQTEVDLGTIPNGQAKQFELSVINTYRDSISIGTKVGCGSCTQAGFYPNNNFASGETRTLQVKYTPSSTGDQVKTVNLVFLPPGSNHSEKIQIRFKAHVV